jgi:predicted GNAT family acetyltransferase
MTPFRDATDEQRFEQGFATASGDEALVFCDYAIRGDTRALLHVEADNDLRGTGAASKFMESLADHARAEKLKLQPICSYAIVWLRRHPQYGDVVA